MAKGTGKKLAIGTIVAGAAGYVAGILTAPKSGKQTRKEVHKKVDKAVSEVEKNLKSVHSDLAKVLDEAKKNTAKVQSSAKTGFADAVSRGMVVKEKVRDLLSTVHEEGGDDKELKQAIKEANDAIRHLKSYITQYEKAAKKALSK